MGLPETRFTETVVFYEMARPDYPQAVLDVLREHSGLSKSHVVADIGSGTGISSRLFLENGNRVFGVEPNAAMIMASEYLAKSYPQFHPVTGASHRTELGTESIDLIVAAQSFHWFNPETTKPEFQRILKSDGHLCLIWNERMTSGDSFLEAYEEFILKHGTDYKDVDHRLTTIQKIEEFFGSDNFWTAELPNSQRLDINGLVARLRSCSYLPSEGMAGFEEMIEDIPALHEKFEENGLVTLSYTTKIYGISRVNFQ